MKRYAIADYLSAEDRAAILAHAYFMPGQPTDELDADGEPIVNRNTVPADKAGCCPLSYLTKTNPAPEAGDVAELLWRRIRWDHHDGQCEGTRTFHGNCGCDERLLELLDGASEAFISDWDARRIPPDELAAAIGATS